MSSPGTFKREPLPITKPAPEPRPTCYGCGMPRRPDYRDVDASGNFAWSSDAVARHFAGWRGYGYFCTQRCAVEYANWVAREKGIRLTRSQ